MYVYTTSTTLVSVIIRAIVYNPRRRMAARGYVFTDGLLYHAGSAAFPLNVVKGPEEMVGSNRLLAFLSTLDTQ
jgi:hypothetical protein